MLSTPFLSSNSKGLFQCPRFFPGFFDGFKGATLASMPQPLQTAFLKVTPDKARLQAMFDRDVQRMANFKDIPDSEMKTIKVPTLIIAGDHDVITTEGTVKMSQAITGSQLTILPGVHGASIGEVCVAEPGSKLPEITALLVEEFLNK